MTEAKDEQIKLRSDLGETKRIQKRHLLKEIREKFERTKIQNLYNARKTGIDFLDEYTSRISAARYQAKQNVERGLKMLTPNQMLQRLLIALAKIKEGNNSESLLNEIRQIVYSLYQSKEITKKVYNNMIKTIKV